MRAGQLRHRVTIAAPSVSPDAYGEPLPTWTDLDTVSASIEPLSGRELANAQQAVEETTHRIRIRYLASVTAQCRVTFGDRVFDVMSVIDADERKRELLLMCKESQ